MQKYLRFCTVLAVITLPVNCTPSNCMCASEDNINPGEALYLTNLVENDNIDTVSCHTK